MKMKKIIILNLFYFGVNQMILSQTYFINSIQDATFGNRALLHTNEFRIGNSSLYTERSKNLLRFGDGTNVQIGEWEVNDKMSFKANGYNFTNGNIGIGTINTAAKLHIESSQGGMGIYINHQALTNYNWAMKINVNQELTKAFIISNSISGEDVFLANGNGKIYANEFNTFSSGSFNSNNIGAFAYGFHAFATNEHAKTFTVTDLNNIEVFNIWGNGIVNAKKILAESFEVRPDAMGINWYDFVFQGSYQLRNIKELETYILLNKHLPDIPSEAEISENGYELIEMNGLLLMKIEELTLYLIEQQKQIEDLKSRIEKIESE